MGPINGREWQGDVRIVEWDGDDEELEDELEFLKLRQADKKLSDKLTDYQKTCMTPENLYGHAEGLPYTPEEGDKIMQENIMSARALQRYKTQIKRRRGERARASARG